MDSGAGLSKEALSEIALKSAEELAREPSAWEADTLSTILKLPRVVVTRPPVKDLIAAGMILHDCHSNCASQAANDPTGTSRHVWGWWIYGPTVVLHSVIEMQGRWLCLTPQARLLPSQFQFIPDSAIEWRVSSDEESNEPFRDGVLLPNALRRYPEHHIRMRDELLALMETGMSAHDAWERVDATRGAELMALPAI
jgi:hypothetical protein